MKYLRLPLLLLAASLAYAPAKLFANPEPSTTTYQLPTQRLFRAVLDKNALAIEDLLKQGGNINEPNKDGDRPIDIAYNQGDFYLVSLLKNYGADAQKERIGKLPQEFKAPPIFEIFFEKSKLKQECIAMLEDTKKAFDQFKQTTQAPEYYSKMDDKEKFYLDFEHATVQEKYPLVYLLLRKQVNVLLAHKSWKPMNKPIQLGMIFSSHEKNLIHHNAHAERETNTIRFGWVFLYNYITNFYTPYTIWNTLAHEWQHLYQLDYSTEIEAANKEVPIEKEIDADFLASKTSLLHTDDVATYAYIKESFIARIYAYLSSKTAYSPTVLVKLSNHILKTIINLDPHFLNSNLNFIETSLIKLIDKAHMYTSQNKSPREYPRYMIQFILDNYQNKMQKPYIQEQQDFASTHPSTKARNENTLKVRCLYEISLLKKYYGTKASVTISPQNAPYLHALITKDLAIAAIEDKSQNQPATDLPQQENSTPPLNPYLDFTYTIQLSDYSNTQILNPSIVKNNAVFDIIFPESFIIFALCNPQPHKVFSSTIIDAVFISRQNISYNPSLKSHWIGPRYQYNKNAFTVFESLYTIGLSLPINPNPFLNHEKAIMLFAQIAHILPELAPQIKDPRITTKIADVLTYADPKANETGIIEIYFNINDASLLSSRKKSQDLINAVSFILFAYIANINTTIELTTITQKIDKTLLKKADDLGYVTLLEKIFSTFFGTTKTSLLQKLIEFNLINTFDTHIKNHTYTDTKISQIKNKNDENLLHAAVISNNPKFINFMLTKKDLLNAQDNQGETPLYFAIKNNFIETIELLIQNNADINTRNKRGETPLYWAIRNKINIDTIKLLLLHNADINATNNNGDAPLHSAIRNKNIETIKLLLQNNANVNATTNNGDTPLHFAIRNKNIETIKLLLQNNADVNAANNNGDTPLHLAINNIFIETIELLLLYNADVNATNNNGDTPLHLAINKNFIETIELLLQHNADTTIKNKNNETPADLAPQYNINLNIK